MIPGLAFFSYFDASVISFLGYIVLIAEPSLESCVRNRTLCKFKNDWKPLIDYFVGNKKMKS